MKTKLLAAFAAASVLALAGCSGGDEVGDVSLGLFTLKDIKINTFQDPKVPGVTCHVASIEANLSLADPSDSSVSCRQTGEITNAAQCVLNKIAGFILFGNFFYFKHFSLPPDRNLRTGSRRSACIQYNAESLKKH